MDFVMIIGLLAGALTTVSLFPQVIKIYKTHSTKDLSVGMFLFFTLGVILWLIYGILENEMPIIVANGVTLVLSVMILASKIRYK